MPRDVSPRTLGWTADPITGKKIYFTKFGTQQLQLIDPAQPALGVKQIDVGQSFKGITTNILPSGFFGTPTIRDTAYPPLTITKGYILTSLSLL